MVKVAREIRPCDAAFILRNLLKSYRYLLGVKFVVQELTHDSSTPNFTPLIWCGVIGVRKLECQATAAG